MRILYKHIFFPLIIFLFLGCKTEYATKDFIISDIPEKPDYSDISSWAAHPQKKEGILNSFYTNKESLKADVFYIYPTLLTSKDDNNWNSDIYNLENKKRVKDIAIQYQASAWTGAGKIYSPYYRQVHYRSFYEPYTSNGGKKAGLVAYQDIKDAFEYYLKYFNQGRPIILAGHSQGAFHCKLLMRDYFDGKELQNQLVAAYIPGVKVGDSEFESIFHLRGPDETGGYLNWNTFKIKRKPKKGKHPAFYSWKKTQFVTNPITWDNERVSNTDDHKGLFSFDKKIYPKALSVQIYDGVLWSSFPKIDNSNLLLRTISNYHFGDINLFWKDIYENAIVRVNSFYNLKKD